MKNRKEVYLKQVAVLEKVLAARTGLLKAKFLTGKKCRLDPQYRQIEGRLKQMKNRLKTMETTEALVQAKKG